jgi:hypothetical protein
MQKGGSTEIETVIDRPLSRLLFGSIEIPSMAVYDGVIRGRCAADRDLPLSVLPKRFMDPLRPTSSPDADPV